MARDKKINGFGLTQTGYLLPKYKTEMSIYSLKRWITIDKVRIVPTDALDCRYFHNATCRSCSELGVSLEISRESKVQDLLGKLAPHITTDTEINSIFGNHPFGSRTRCKMAVGGTCSEPLIGFVESTHTVSDISQCPLHTKLIGDVLIFLKQIITDYKLTPYDIAQRSGELKYILLHANADSSEAMLRFVLRSTEAIARIQKALPIIQQLFPALKVISANIQPLPAAIVEGTEEHILTQQTELWDQFNQTPVCFSPQSFSQVNHEIAASLYSTAGKLLTNIKPEGVFDLYCGVGCFSFFAASHCNWCIGIELSSAAISAANKTKARNGFDNLRFETDDTAHFLATYQATRPDLIIVNPPRRGLGNELCGQLVELNSQWILYSSCNPTTLTADLDRLVSRYTLKFLQPFDMFPLTKHLETLVLLERN